MNRNFECINILFNDKIIKSTYILQFEILNYCKTKFRMNKSQSNLCDDHYFVIYTQVFLEIKLKKMLF